MLTLQQIFDKVATHLLTQNARSVGPDGRKCRYRGEAGRRCAVGCLIPDSAYSELIEGLGVGVLLETPNIPSSNPTGRDRLHSALGAGGVDFRAAPRAFMMLQTLQGLHDNRSPEAWPELLREIAADFDLEFKGA